MLGKHMQTFLPSSPVGIAVSLGTRKHHTGDDKDTQFLENTFCMLRLPPAVLGSSLCQSDWKNQLSPGTSGDGASNTHAARNVAAVNACRSPTTPVDDAVN
jgi:hypothetical protein